MSFAIWEHADSSIRVAHITFGTLAVFLGVLALIARKGSPLHTGAGRWFALCMIAASLLGAVLGALAYQTFYITAHAGILATTLILTGQQIVMERSAPISLSFGVLTLLSGLNTLGLLFAASYASQQPQTVVFGFAAADYAFLAGISGVALVGEIRILLRKSLSLKHRLSAHLWRMCCAFFIAAGSAFNGPGAQFFPEAVRMSGVLSLPEAIIFCVMLYWLFRVWRGKSGAAEFEAQ